MSCSSHPFLGIVRQSRLGLQSASIMRYRIRHSIPLVLVSLVVYAWDDNPGQGYWRMQWCSCLFLRCVRIIFTCIPIGWSSPLIDQSHPSTNTHSAIQQSYNASRLTTIQALQVPLTTYKTTSAPYTTTAST